MPFAFIIVGLVLVVSGAKNTTSDLTGLLKGDFTGSNNFIYWLISFLVIGSMGYVQELRPASRAFMVLVIIGIFLSNKGFFSQFQNAISGTNNA